jgi:hypothetical protein
VARGAGCGQCRHRNQPAAFMHVPAARMCDGTFCFTEQRRQVAVRTLTVKSRDGQTTYRVRMADNVAVRGIVKASLSDIKPDSFIGVTGMPQADGTQKAVEIDRGRAEHNHRDLRAS